MVFIYEIRGQHLRGEATDEKEIAIGDEGDYFDHIDLYWISTFLKLIPWSKKDG